MTNSKEYLQRTFMGLGTAVSELFGKSSQELTNLFTSYIGAEIGKMLLDKGLVSHDTPIPELIEVLARELEFGAGFDIISRAGSVTLKIIDCNVCPSKVGGETFVTSVCPIPGIIRGAIDVVKGTSGEGYAKLKPGEGCEVISMIDPEEP
ncbi:MAG: hypothetical protein EF813_10140 [Methanosarcinales archaeon]|nr:MAG: hypothetical protein EF813_10140 [Methanosarcinales archaeon]